ncbi:hypothetical protein ACLB2K_013433 [Fragaria x ananassa]
MYKAQSQDEDALVHAAAQLHMVFVNKNANILEIKFNGSTVQYEALDILEFTSDRKRMSVVDLDPDDPRRWEEPTDPLGRHLWRQGHLVVSFEEFMDRQECCNAEEPETRHRVINERPFKKRRISEVGK